MKRLYMTIWIGVIAVGSFVPAGWAQKESQVFMRRKLAYAGGVLNGLVLQKYDLVISNAVPLRDMSVTNAFSALQNPEYMSRTTNFYKAVDSLISAAKSQNLDRATDAYARVTRSCVDCHQFFRREQRVKTPEPRTTK